MGDSSRDLLDAVLELQTAIEGPPAKLRAKAAVVVDAFLHAEPFKFIDLRGFAEAAGMTYKAMEHRRARGGLPEPTITLGASPGWSAYAVELWIEDHS